MNQNTKIIECALPVLQVRSVQASVDFYCERLGFSLDWGEGDSGLLGFQRFRDGHAILLMENSTDFTPGWVWIGVENDAIFAEFRSAGATVVQEPVNQPWAYEMKFEDPDGNILWLGTEPR